MLAAGGRTYCSLSQEVGASTGIPLVCFRKIVGYLYGTSPAIDVYSLLSLSPCAGRTSSAPMSVVHHIPSDADRSRALRSTRHFLLMRRLIFDKLLYHAGS